MLGLKLNHVSKRGHWSCKNIMDYFTDAYPPLGPEELIFVVVKTVLYK